MASAITIGEVPDGEVKQISNPLLAADQPLATPSNEIIASSSNNDDDIEEARRKEQLRKAGKEYFEKALAQAGKGKDPFLSEAPMTKQQRAQQNKPVAEDPDIVAFGQLFESTKLYVFMGLYVLCQSFSFVLVKKSLDAMQTPAVLTFLHMLGAVGTIWLGSMYDVFDLSPLTVSTFKGSAVRMVLSASQLLFTFSAIHRSSVIMVLCWVSTASAAVDVAFTALLLGRPPSQDVKPALAVGLAAMVLEILVEREVSWVAYLMLTLWTLSKAAEWLWRLVKADPSLGGRVTDLGLQGRVRDLADEEDALGSSTMAFMTNLGPAVPVLLLGFMALEGDEIVNHELSVPAVTVMLLAILAYSCATACQLLLDERLSAQAKLLLKASTLLGTLVCFALEEGFHLPKLGLLLTLMATTSSLYVTWLQRVMQAAASS